MWVLPPVVDIILILSVDTNVRISSEAGSPQPSYVAYTGQCAFVQIVAADADLRSADALLALSTLCALLARGPSVCLDCG